MERGWSFIILNWEGKMLTGEQALVIRKAAAAFPNPEKDNAAVQFEHSLCDGLLTCKGEKTFGTFAGIAFSAYLGTYKNKPWKYEFLLLGSAFDDDEDPDAPIYWSAPRRRDGKSHGIKRVHPNAAKGIKLTRLSRN